MSAPLLDRMENVATKNDLIKFREDILLFIVASAAAQAIVILCALILLHHNIFITWTGLTVVPQFDCKGAGHTGKGPI